MIALVGGYAADALFGDPRRWHPVAGFGNVALAVERATYKPTRLRGTLHAAGLVLAAAAAGELLARVAGRATRAAGEPRAMAGGSPARGSRARWPAAAAALCARAAAARAAAWRSPRSPGPRSAGARSPARRCGSPAASSATTSRGRGLRPSLCGRDPAGLDAPQLCRAAVESVAENTSDAVVGALVWGAVAGPAGVAAYRAANTLDAMVGHRSER